VKQRHYRQQSIFFGEPEPTADLACVRDHVAVREQAAFWFAGGARGVNDDRFVIEINVGNWCVIWRVFSCGFEFVVEANDCLRRAGRS
jgi:hypothetical protein